VNNIENENLKEIGTNEIENRKLVADISQGPGLFRAFADKKSDAIKSFMIGFAGGLGFFIATKIYESMTKREYKRKKESEEEFEL